MIKIGKSIIRIFCLMILKQTFTGNKHSLFSLNTATECADKNDICFRMYTLLFNKNM